MKPAATGARASLSVAVVQMNSHGGMAENLSRIERMARRAVRLGAEVVLFPECATTGYARGFDHLATREGRRELAWALHGVAGLAAALGTHLLVGSPMVSRGRLYNCLAVFDRSGHLAHAYAKCQLTPGDRRWFTPGDSLSWFEIEGWPATAMICHERRFPELVRLPVMAGARLIFHPNAGLDALAVSRRKRGGRDGIVARAFENAVPYVFANTVGRQGENRWSAGDSKIVGADARLLRVADHRSETVLVARLERESATGKYAVEALDHPRHLAPHWRRMLRGLPARARAVDAGFRAWLGGDA